MNPIEGSTVPQRKKPTFHPPHSPEITLSLPEKVIEPLAMGTLKHGILNNGINTGHSLSDAIRFLAKAPELKKIDIVIYTCSPASERTISLNKKSLPYLGTHDNPLNIIITERVEKKFDRTETLRFIPEDYILVITMDNTNTDMVGSVVLEVADTYGNFMSKVGKILENIPPNWKVFRSNWPTPNAQKT